MRIADNGNGGHPGCGLAFLLPFALGALLFLGSIMIAISQRGCS